MCATNPFYPQSLENRRWHMGRNKKKKENPQYGLDGGTKQYRQFGFGWKFCSHWSDEMFAEKKRKKKKSSDGWRHWMEALQLHGAGSGKITTQTRTTQSCTSLHVLAFMNPALRELAAFAWPHLITGWTQTHAVISIDFTCAWLGRGILALSYPCTAPYCSIYKPKEEKENKYSLKLPKQNTYN